VGVAYLVLGMKRLLLLCFGFSVLLRGDTVSEGSQHFRHRSPHPPPPPWREITGGGTTAEERRQGRGMAYLVLAKKRWLLLCSGPSVLLRGDRGRGG
jgi:hypothetical protein